MTMATAELRRDRLVGFDRMGMTAAGVVALRRRRRTGPARKAATSMAAGRVPCGADDGAGVRRAGLG